MNKFTILIGILLLTGYSGLKAQDNPGFTINTVNSSGKTKPDGSLEITINGGIPSYTVCLFDKAPWKGGTEIERFEGTDLLKVSFHNLLPGNYFVIVEDSEKNPVAGTATIGVIPNN